MSFFGGRTKKGFDRSGPPEDVAPGGPRKDSVLVKDGSFGFRLRDRVVYDCDFWAAWPGTIRGIRIGDTREAVVKVLGPKDRDAKNGDGGDDYAWD